MDIKDLETYEQLQLEAIIRGMSILEFIKENKNYEVDNKYFIYGKRIFAFNKNGKFLNGDYKVDGNFSCAWCDSLTSLEGTPKVVKKHFNCRWCNKLTSLKGAPEEVGGNFWCDNCNKLTSLEGALEAIGGDFNCSDCKNLPRNIKKPEGVKGNFYRL